MKNRTQINILAWIFILIVAACGHAKKSDGPPPELPPPAPAASASVPSVSMEPEAPALPAPPKPPQSVAVVTRTFRLQKGFLTNQKPRPQLVSKSKNEKTPGYTTDTCWSYGEFAILETKSTDELGSAEVVVRYGSPEHKKLCGADFKGRVKALNITEGHFAGVVGDFLFIEGDDMSEGLPEFQVFSITSGEQVFRSSHNPQEEFTVTEKGDQVSVQLFAKLKVSCELAADGAECWKKVLSSNGVRRPTPMPDCKSAFAAAKVGEFEPALVTTLAKISDLKSPKIQFLGGKATCAPAP